MESTDTTTARKRCWRQQPDHARLAREECYKHRRRVVRFFLAKQRGKRLSRCLPGLKPDLQTPWPFRFHHPEPGASRVVIASKRLIVVQLHFAAQRLTLRHVPSDLRHRGSLKTPRRVSCHAWQPVSKLHFASPGHHERIRGHHQKKPSSVVQHASSLFLRRLLLLHPRHVETVLAIDPDQCPTIHPPLVPELGHGVFDL